MPFLILEAIASGKTINDADKPPANMLPAASVAMPPPSLGLKMSKMFATYNNETISHK